MSSVGRPNDSGRKDSKGRTIRVSDQASASRADAPPPPDTPRWERPDRRVYIATSDEKYPRIAIGATADDARQKLVEQYGDDMLANCRYPYDSIDEMASELIRIDECPIGGSAIEGSPNAGNGKQLPGDQNHLWYCAVDLYDTIHGIGRTEDEARKAALSAARKYLHARTTDRYKTLDAVADYFGANTQQLGLDEPAYLWH